MRYEVNFIKSKSMNGLTKARRGSSLLETAGEIRRNTGGGLDLRKTALDEEGLLLRKLLLRGHHDAGMVSLDNEAAGSPHLERVSPPLYLVGWYNGDAFLHLNARCNHLGVGREAIANVIILCFDEIDEKVRRCFNGKQTL